MELITAFRLVGRDVESVEKILNAGSVVELSKKEVKIASHENVFAARSLVTGNASRLETLGKLSLDDIPRSKVNGLLATCKKASAVLATVSHPMNEKSHADSFWPLVIATGVLGTACLGLFWKLRMTSTQSLAGRASG